MGEDRFLSTQEVAKMLSVSPETVKKWLRDGHLRGFKMVKVWRIKESDLEDFLEESVNR